MEALPQVYEEVSPLSSVAIGGIAFDGNMNARALESSESYRLPEIMPLAELLKRSASIGLSLATRMGFLERGRLVEEETESLQLLCSASINIRFADIGADVTRHLTPTLDPLYRGIVSVEKDANYSRLFTLIGCNP